MKRKNFSFEPGRRLSRIIGFVAITSAGGACVLAGPAAAETAAVSNEQFSFAPAAGQMTTYEVTSRGVAGMNYEVLTRNLSPEQKSAGALSGVVTHDYEVSATVGLRVLGQSHDGHWVALRVENPEYKIDGELDQRATRLSVPCLVKYDASGAVLDIEFPVGLPTEAQLAIRGLIEPLQLVFDKAGKESWIAHQRDATGSSNIRYTLRSQTAERATLKRKLVAAKRSGTQFISTRGKRSKFRTKIEASDGEVVWDKKQSLVERVQFTEKTAFYDGRTKVSTNEQTFTAVRSQKKVRNIPASMSAMRKALIDITFGRAALYDVDPRTKKNLENVTWEQILNHFLTSGMQAPSDAVHLMSSFLRVHPEHCAPFAQRLNEVVSEENWDIVSLGFTTLARAGHTEAQQVIANALTSSNFDFLSRKAALDATMSLDIPEPFMVDAVWTFRERLAEDGLDTRMMINMSTNVFGALGDINHGVPGNSKEVVSRLTTALQDADDVTETCDALTALGNVHDPARVLPVTATYFTHHSPVVRQRAFETFLGAQGEENFILFAERYAAENNPAVKRDVTSIALSMGTSKARNAWAVTLLSESGDQLSKMRASEMLGRAVKEFPENRAVMARLLETETDREVRKQLYRYARRATGGAK